MGFIDDLQKESIDLYQATAELALDMRRSHLHEHKVFIKFVAPLSSGWCCDFQLRRKVMGDHYQNDVLEDDEGSTPLRPDERSRFPLHLRLNFFRSNIHVVAIIWQRDRNAPNTIKCTGVDWVQAEECWPGQYPAQRRSLSKSEIPWDRCQITGMPHSCRIAVTA